MMGTEQDLRIFLDWMNNYITVAMMAEYYQCTELEMLGHIARGRTFHDYIEENF